MTVTINGVVKDSDDGRTLGEIVSAHCGDTREVIVDLNGKIAPKERWPEIRLGEGDRIEMIEVVGGG